MAVVANKRSVMTMYSSARSVYSHRVRLVLAEKNITVDNLREGLDQCRVSCGHHPIPGGEEIGKVGNCLHTGHQLGLEFHPEGLLDVVHQVKD